MNLKFSLLSGGEGGCFGRHRVAAEKGPHIALLSPSQGTHHGRSTRNNQRGRNVRRRHPRRKDIRPRLKTAITSAPLQNCMPLLAENLGLWAAGEAAAEIRGASLPCGTVYICSVHAMRR